MCNQVDCCCNIVVCCADSSAIPPYHPLLLHRNPHDQSSCHPRRLSSGQENQELFSSTICARFIFEFRLHGSLIYIITQTSSDNPVSCHFLNGPVIFQRIIRPTYKPNDHHIPNSNNRRFGPRSDVPLRPTTPMLREILC